MKRTSTRSQQYLICRCCQLARPRKISPFDAPEKKGRPKTGKRPRRERWEEEVWVVEGLEGYESPKGKPSSTHRPGVWVTSLASNNSSKKTGNPICVLWKGKYHANDAFERTKGTEVLRLVFWSGLVLLRPHGVPPLPPWKKRESCPLQRRTQRWKWTIKKENNPIKLC